MIHILQLLCPKRHAICAIPYDAEAMTKEEARAMGQKFIKEIGINPWCGICGSAALGWEDGTTKFKTMEEAAPHLEKVQRNNLETRALLDAMGQTYDRHRAN